MLEPVFQFVEKFVTDFSWKRLILFFSFLSLILSVFVAYEWYTSSYELKKYESAVGILKELDPLVRSGTPEVSEAAKNIISKISVVVNQEGYASALELTFSPRISQAIFSGLPWLIFLLLYLPSAIKNSKQDAYHAVIGMSIIAMIAAFIGALFPEDWNNWLRYGVPQAINIAVLFILAHIGNKE